MRLFLASYHLEPNGQKLAGLIAENKKIAVIPNALDVYPDGPRRIESVEREKSGLTGIGLIPQELDLRNYIGKPEELKTKLSEFGFIWVLGGNTFVLRRAYKEAGMDNWLQEHSGDKGFVYAGYSAGVCILSPSLKGLETVDEPNKVPDGYNAEVIWDGIGLIDFAFCPHYMSNHPESEAVNSEVEYYKRHGVEYRTLHDEEVIIMDSEIKK